MKPLNALALLAFVVSVTHVVRTSTAFSSYRRMAPLKIAATITNSGMRPLLAKKLDLEKRIDGACFKTGPNLISGP